MRALPAAPDAVVISGDLTDNGLVAEYRLLADMLRRTLTMPVFVVPGNHDRREVLRVELAHLPGVTDDPTYVQFTADIGPVRLVMLDTAVPGFGHGALDGGRLEWLDARLAAAPDRPTMIVMHHPPFVCGIRHMDAINLFHADAFAAIVAKHRHVRRIVCGHHHRPVVAPVAHAIASICPSVAHQVELSLHADDPGMWNLEPSAYQLHLVADDGAIVSHTALVESFPGPFPFVTDPDYPGKGG